MLSPEPQVLHRGASPGGAGEGNGWQAGHSAVLRRAALSAAVRAGEGRGGRARGQARTMILLFAGETVRRGGARNLGWLGVCRE